MCQSLKRRFISLKKETGGANERMNACLGAAEGVGWGWGVIGKIGCRRVPGRGSEVSWAQQFWRD